MMRRPWPTRGCCTMGREGEGRGVGNDGIKSKVENFVNVA